MAHGEMVTIVVIVAARRSAPSGGGGPKRARGACRQRLLDARLEPAIATPKPSSHSITYGARTLVLPRAALLRGVLAIARPPPGPPRTTPAVGRTAGPRAA